MNKQAYNDISMGVDNTPASIRYIQDPHLSLSHDNVLGTNNTLNRLSTTQGQNYNRSMVAANKGLIQHFAKPSTYKNWMRDSGVWGLRTLAKVPGAPFRIGGGIADLGRTLMDLPNTIAGGSPVFLYGGDNYLTRIGKGVDNFMLKLVGNPTYSKPLRSYYPAMNFLEDAGSETIASGAPIAIRAINNVARGKSMANMPPAAADMLRQQGFDPSDFYLQYHHKGNVSPYSVSGNNNMVRAAQSYYPSQPASPRGRLDIDNTFWAPPGNTSAAYNFYTGDGISATSRPLLVADVHKAPLVRRSDNSIYRKILDNRYLKKFPKVHKKVYDILNKRLEPLTTLDAGIDVYAKNYPELVHNYRSSAVNQNWAVAPGERQMLYDLQKNVPYSGQYSLGTKGAPSPWTRDMLGRPVGKSVGNMHYEITRNPGPGVDVRHVITPYTGLRISPGGNDHFVLTRVGDLGRSIKIPPVSSSMTQYSYSIPTGWYNSPYIAGTLPHLVSNTPGSFMSKARNLSIMSKPIGNDK